MAKRHRDILVKLDSVAVQRYRITEKDIRIIEQYLDIIQGDLRFASTWQEIINFPGPYATSIVVHELVEITQLLEKSPNLLKLKTQELQQLLAANVTAHVMGIYEEHIFLQEYIGRAYQQQFQVATLIKANRRTNNDLQLFLESDVGVFILDEDQVEVARGILAELKGESR